MNLDGCRKTQERLTGNTWFAENKSLQLIDLLTSPVDLRNVLYWWVCTYLPLCLSKLFFLLGAFDRQYLNVDIHTLWEILYFVPQCALLNHFDCSFFKSGALTVTDKNVLHVYQCFKGFLPVQKTVVNCIYSLLFKAYRQLKGFN